MGRVWWNRLQEPSWLGRIVAFLGLVTLVSALLPAIRARLHLVTDVLPSVFPAAATTGALATGVLLLLLSRGLRRGKFRAWLLATILTAVTAVLHVVKGLDVEEAALSLGLLVLLLAARRRFTARPDPRSLSRVLVVLLAGPVIATALGWAWIGIDADGQAPGTTTWQRIEHAFVGLFGITGPVHFVHRSDAEHAAIALVVLGAALLVPLLMVALQPADGPHAMSEEEGRSVAGLLTRWGCVDSLSYFATREDRSVIFSRTGKAAVSYRVVGTVSLAAGDPLGDPEAWPGAIEAWLEEARSFGWVPAALGVSEAAATAYHRAGLDALELGDEAVVHVEDFTLEGRSMRVVRQAVSRCDRAGLTVTCQRVRDLDDGARALIRAKADEWRDGDVERGFSMALGRFVDERDGASVVVLCHDTDGHLRGLLNLVPWGEDGLSLDLMRRDRGTENGIVEHMVTALWRACPELGVRRFSLNFAVFRNVFARGERLGAGPALRLWRSVLLAASRFWQIETLYRANAKYQPEWVPRFVVFRSPGDLARVGTAALRAEAFLVAPVWWQRLAARIGPTG
ncbi:MAG: phosphatidylglycerol lysyltransferase domain-containing protein [Marmoricola sp.]